MIATIRIHENGSSRFLCELDILKFSKESILERMEERGIREDAFFVCGFSDWGIDTIMDLDEAYLLKRAIEGLYDGDNFIVRYLLERHKTIREIVSNRWVFKTKDELAVMQHLLKDVESDRLLKLFFDSGSWVTVITSYVEAGYLLNTPKGFYIRAEDM